MKTAFGAVALLQAVAMLRCSMLILSNLTDQHPHLHLHLHFKETLLINIHIFRASLISGLAQLELQSPSYQPVKFLRLSSYVCLCVVIFWLNLYQCSMYHLPLLPLLQCLLPFCHFYHYCQYCYIAILSPFLPLLQFYCHYCQYRHYCNFYCHYRHHCHFYCHHCHLQSCSSPRLRSLPHHHCHQAVQTVQVFWF